MAARGQRWSLSISPLGALERFAAAAARVVPVSVAVRAVVDPHAGVEAEADVTVRAGTTGAATVTWLLNAGFRTEGASLDGRRCELGVLPTPLGKVIRCRLPRRLAPDDEATVRLRYGGAPRPGAGVAWIGSGGAELGLFSLWYPFMYGSDALPSMDVEATVPAAWNVATGGEPAGEEPATWGRRRLRFVDANPVPMAGLVAGPWDAHTRARDGVEVSVLAPPPAAARPERIAETLDWAHDALAVYRRRFGPFPYRHTWVYLRPRQAPPVSTAVAGGVMLARHRWGGGRDEIDRAALVAHEIAHHWWGLQARPGPRDGGWMFVESLAEWASILAVGDILGPGAATEKLRRNRAWYREASAGLGLRERPLAGIRAADLPIRNYTAVLYCRVSLFFAALDEAVG